MVAIGLVLSVLIGVSLGFFGGGGSILTVPVLVYVFGLDPKEAIASSLLIVGVASASGAWGHARAGNIRPRQGLVFGAAGMIGAYLGGRASAYLDGALLLLLFAAMMLLSASAMWRGRAPGRSALADSEAKRSEVKLFGQGLAVGGFTGLVGAGGGFLIVPALIFWAGLSAPAAVGTSLLIIVMKSLTGFLGYASHVAVDFSLIALVAGAAVVGSFLGTRLAAQIEPRALQRAFAGFVMLMAVFILLREGTTVVSAILPALPTTWPQVVFATALLLLGGVAGRASIRAEKGHADLVLTQGAGI